MPLLAASVLLSSLATREAGGLSIENVEPGTTVRTSALVLRGKSPETSVRLAGSGASVIFPVVNGQWAGIVSLKPGANMVSARSGGASVKVKVTYVPMRNPNTVRAVFLVAKDEEPGYIGHEGVGEADVRAHYVTMLRAIQAFCAEAMNEGGYGRKAFALATDEKGNIAVDFVRLDMTGDELRKHDGNELYAMMEPILAKRYDFSTTKTIALMGFTRFDPATGKTTGHTALGGGGLALFGSGPMRFWPASLADLPRAFEDGRHVDPKAEFDDSAYRETPWGTAATTFGACLHEMGHTFGLPHSPDPRCIMSRGFDHINRAWDLRESYEGKPDAVFTPETRAHWDPAWAMRLDLSPWFQPDGPPAAIGPAPVITISGETATISGTDLRVFGHWVEGPNFGVTQAESTRIPDTAPLTTVTFGDLLKTLKKDEKLHLYVIDRFGRDADVIANP